MLGSPTEGLFFWQGGQVMSEKTTGRNEKIVDWSLVERKLIAGCNGTEIAGFLGMHHDTFYRKVEETYGISFTAYMQQKRSIGDTNLREVQYNKAIEGDNAMLIWLGKNRLKQSESPQEIAATLEITSRFDKVMSQLSSLQSDCNIADNTVRTDNKS